MLIFKVIHEFLQETGFACYKTCNSIPNHALLLLN